MTSKAAFSIAELKAAFPQYHIIHSDDPAPVRATVMLPHGILATVELARGVLTTTVEASWGAGRTIAFTPDAEAAAMDVIEKDLLPAWKAAGFEPTGDRAFDDDTPEAEPHYIVALGRPIRTLNDVKATFDWLADDAELSVQV